MRRRSCTATDFLIVIVIVAIVVLLFTSAFLSGKNAEKNKWRADITKKGLAEYIIINSETGETEWRWRECKCQ